MEAFRSGLLPSPKEGKGGKEAAIKIARVILSLAHGARGTIRTLLFLSLFHGTMIPRGKDLSESKSSGGEGSSPEQWPERSLAKMRKREPREEPLLLDKTLEFLKVLGHGFLGQNKDLNQGLFLCAVQSMFFVGGCHGERKKYSYQGLS